jgi:hypothetical protein
MRGPQLLWLAAVSLACACGTPDGITAPGAKASQSIAVGFDLPATVPSGGTFPVTITLTNTSAAAVILELAGKPERTYFNLVVMRLTGDTVLTVPNATSHLRIAHVVALRPQQQFGLGDELVLPGATQRVLPPGEYRVRAEVLGRDRIVSATKRLTVTP